MGPFDRLRQREPGNSMIDLRRAVIALTAAFVGVLLIQHALHPHLTVDRHTISEYVNGSYGWLMTAGFLVWTASLALSAALVRRAGGSGGRLRVMEAMLVVSAISMLCTTAFATDTAAGVLPPGAERSTAGAIHDLASGIAAIALAGAAATSVGVLSSRAIRRSVVGLLAGALAAAAVLLLVGDPAPGVRQRILVAAALVWQTLFAHDLKSRGCALAPPPA